MPVAKFSLMFRFFSILWLFVVMWFSNANAQLFIDEISHHNRPHYRVNASKMVWLVDKYSGGISSLIDCDDNDWVGWSRLAEEKYPESAAADFRGMPNLVFGGDDNGIGHPGFEKALCFKEGMNKIRVKSLNGKWEWLYIFHPKYVELQILRNPSERNYWFLYEGIPGGEYNPEKQYWGTESGINNAKPDYYKGEEVYGFWRWVFFGHENRERVLFVVQQKEDERKEIFGYLGNSEDGLNSENGMVVFGFGRDKNATPLLNQKNTFYIGFYEKKVDANTFPKLKQHIAKSFY